MSDDALPRNIEHKDTKALPMSGECLYTNTRRGSMFYYMYQFVGHALWLTLVFNFRRPRHYFIGITISPVRCYTNQTYMLRINKISPGLAFARWNAHVGNVIQVGSCIQRVNGVSGNWREMIRILKSENIVSLSVATCVATYNNPMVLRRIDPFIRNENYSKQQCDIYITLRRHGDMNLGIQFETHNRQRMLKIAHVDPQSVVGSWNKLMRTSKDCVREISKGDILVAVNNVAMDAKAMQAECDNALVFRMKLRSSIQSWEEYNL